MIKKLLGTAGMLLFFIAVAGCGVPVVKMASSAQQQFDLAKKEFDREHWLTASEGFQKVIFNFPGATVVDTAQYYLGLSYFNNKDYELAAVEFKRLISNYPQSAFVDEAQYSAGVCYLKNTPGHYALDQEDLRKAIQSLRDFIIDNPDSPLVEDAKKAILDGQTKLARKEYQNAVFYSRIYDYRAAEIYFQYVIDDYTDTEYAALALFKIGEIYYKMTRYTDALGKFNSFITLFPSSEMIPKAQEYVEKINRHLETVDASGES